MASLLAIVQGITEFLPVSSSAHLILPAQLLDLPDQGLLFDTAVHGGTLLAVMFYYRKDIGEMLGSWLSKPKTAQQEASRQLLLWLVLASIPVLLVGYLSYDFVSSELRSVAVIASTTIIFGVILGLAARGKKTKGIPTAMIILLCGIAQILALIPGVSRSGISMTVALAAGYEGQSAARISFLLAMPVIGAAFAYGILQIILAGDFQGLALALWGALLSAVFAYFTIDFFIRFVKRIGMMPFVIYRLLLGAVLWLWLII